MPKNFVSRLAARRSNILFVGTKRRAKDVIAEESVRCGMYYVNEDGSAGFLTNFATSSAASGRLRDIEAMATDGDTIRSRRRKSARNEKGRRKLTKNLEGSANDAAARRGFHRRHEKRNRSP